MMKPLGLEQLLKMAEDERSIPLTVLIQAILTRFKEQDAKWDQIMQTHAALFEEKVQELKNGIKQQIEIAALDWSGLATKRIDEMLERLDALERPGKTDNNMRG